MIIGILIGLALGAVIGHLGTRLFSRPDVGAVSASPGAGEWVANAAPSEDRRPPDVVQPPDGAAAPEAGALAAVLDRLELGVVVSDSDGVVVHRNTSADVMSGTHVGVIVDGHVENALRTALGGARCDKRIDLHGPPRVSLELVAEPIEGGAVAIVNDVGDRTRIDAMRTDFVANISHELKTPVGAIAVLAEALDVEGESEIVTRIAGRIVTESHRAVTAIDDLLELSRIESARLVEDHVVLGDLVEQAVMRGHDADGSKTVDVTAFETAEPVVVRGDHRQLLSAIGNLVENAVKYSDDHGVVQVRTRVDDRYVEVMVSDQGVGIPERDLDRVFERFYRVDRSRRRGTGGTGLGLSIVRNVASNHGGEVIVSSQEGEGSTFVLRLPATLLVGASASPENAADATTFDDATDTVPGGATGRVTDTAPIRENSLHE